jgi:SAM-dependent methyltransferase
MQYLPGEHDSVIVDIGPGDGAFAKFASLESRKEYVYLLDQNPSSVEALKKAYPHAELYRAPSHLSFRDKTVSFIHLSHIVEHLYHEDLYVFLKEIDRVLKPGGNIVLSTPLLWDRFHDDMSHVKPYNPEVFINYLCSGRENASAGVISTDYIIKELVYRYRVISEPEWGSKFFVADAFIRICRIILSKLGFRRYIKNGYTLVLQKSK